VQLRLTFLLFGVGLFLIQAPVRAILIEEKGPSKRGVVAGYLLKEDKSKKRIFVRVKVPGGEDKEEWFDLSKINVKHRVDLERLKELTRDNSQAYCDYAEKLAEKKDDPEATELALRLFLIAAYLDTPKLGSSCLLKMSALAADPADKRKYQALAFLLDPGSDAALLKPEPGKAPPPPQSKTAKDPLFYFRKALRQYRNGQFTLAQDNAKADAVGFKTVPGFMDQKSFYQACKDALTDPSLSVDNMDAVMRAEIWALDQILPAESAAKKGASGGWSRALSNQLTPVPLLSLETITEFDPRKCVFRDGTWVEP
jgi:hypothetical protein